jgi:hypothetical protein
LDHRVVVPHDERQDTIGLFLTLEPGLGLAFLDIPHPGQPFRWEHCAWSNSNRGQEPFHRRDIHRPVLDRLVGEEVIEFVELRFRKRLMKIHHLLLTTRRTNQRPNSLTLNSVQGFVERFAIAGKRGIPNDRVPVFIDHLQKPATLYVGFEDIYK